MVQGLGATNEAILQTSFRVLLFSREVFETMKFTKLLYDVKCSNKMVLYTGMTAVVLVNQDMKKQP